jgi:hypothetical protein
LFAAFFTGPAIVIFERDPEGKIWPWALMTLAALALIVHRLGIKYSVDDSKATATSWWGKGRSESILLKDLARAETHYSFSSRIVGVGHIYLSSLNQSDPGFFFLAQKRPERLAARLLALADKARANPEGVEAATSGPLP